mgnify:CR=1 FL=1
MKTLRLARNEETPEPSVEIPPENGVFIHGVRAPLNFDIRLVAERSGNPGTFLERALAGVVGGHQEKNDSRFGEITSSSAAIDRFFIALMVFIPICFERRQVPWPRRFLCRAWRRAAAP